MNNYTVDLCDNNSMGCSSSLTNGLYGFDVKANSMDDAEVNVIKRAKNGKFFGYNWTARIVRLHKNGQRDQGDCWQEMFSKDRERIIDLF